MYDEKGHRGMALAFYLTGKQRTGVVGVKVEKVFSIRLLLLITNYFISLSEYFQ